MILVSLSHKRWWLLTHRILYHLNWCCRLILCWHKLDLWSHIIYIHIVLLWVINVAAIQYSIFSLILDHILILLLNISLPILTNIFLVILILAWFYCRFIIIHILQPIIILVLIMLMVFLFRYILAHFYLFLP